MLLDFAFEQGRRPAQDSKRIQLHKNIAVFNSYFLVTSPNPPHQTQTCFVMISLTPLIQLILFSKEAGEQKCQMHYVNQCGSKKLLLLCQMWAFVCVGGWVSECVCVPGLKPSQYSPDADFIWACTSGLAGWNDAALCLMRSHYI